MGNLYLKSLQGIFYLAFFCLAYLPLKAQENWTIDLPSVASFSSPRVSDLNKDGIGDIVMGAGRVEFQSCDSAVIAIDGYSGQLLWKVSAKDQIFGSAIFLDTDADGISEVFIGGRSAEMIAINGKTGQVIWRFLKINQAIANLKWFNFYNPQLIPDQDNDGLADLLVANGGDVMVEPHDPKRPPGYLLVLSSKTGKLLAKAEMPDGKEIYMSPLVSQTPKGMEVVFGTGGETVGGNLYVTTLKDIFAEDLSQAILLDSSANKGYIGPPSRADLNQDGILDIITNAVNGRVLSFDGKTYQPLWEVGVPNSESYSSVALGYFNQDKVPDVFVSFGSGVWPKLEWGIQMMINGANGKVEYVDSLGFYQNTSPIVADLNEDGVDEIIMSLNYQEVDENYLKFFYNTLIVIVFKSKEIIQIANKLEGNNLSSTPWIGDLDNNGFLDIIYCHGTNSRQTYTFDGMKVHKLITQIPVSKSIKWGAYQGSNYNGIFKK